MLSIFLIAACTVDKAPIERAKEQITTGNNNVQGTDAVKKFESKEALMNFLDKAGAFQSRINYYGRSGGIMALGDTAMKVSAPSAESSSGSGQSATDYSTTNIQVEGVDEADFIKNDGKYIYMISQNKLLIVDAYPAEDAKIISETKLSGNVRDLFLNGDKVIVFIDANDYVYSLSEYDFVPRPVYRQKTHAVVYDISDKKDPKVEEDYDTKGYYITSRMIGDYVYMVVQDPVQYYGRAVDMPMVKAASGKMIRPDIYYFDNQEDNYNFNTVLSFNVNEKDSIKAKTFMMGYSNTIYVSEKNIYITYQKNFPYYFYERNNEERFYEVVLPLLSKEVRDEVDSVKSDSSLAAYEKWAKISSKVEEMFNNMDDKEKDNYVSKVNDAIAEYELKRDEERRKTIIHKILIDKGDVNYEKKGEVKGYLLNQFSMDESGENFRVATTFESWSSGKNIQYNNVYVLDKDMETVGKLEKIAPDERIYSTRFIGDRLYMVTFKRIDPFFVIGLSDAKNPKVLGELKIPGFSDYLHPYDENHIIGIGKETGENEWGGISTKGIKIALFDVTDVENPKLVDKYDIGEQGTDSEALQDHKAFLFDKKKGLLAIPVREVKGKQYYDSRLGYYTQRVWQGAYVFKVSDEGFKLDGKISHGEAEENYYYWYGAPSAVRRILFMDDTLYTVSQKKIVANDLTEISDEIGSVKLPFEMEQPQPIPYGRGMMVDAVGK